MEPLTFMPEDKLEVFKKIVSRDLSSFKGCTCSFEGELGDPMVHPQVASFIDIGCKTFFSLKMDPQGGFRGPN